MAWLLLSRNYEGFEKIHQIGFFFGNRLGGAHHLDKPSIRALGNDPGDNGFSTRAGSGQIDQ